MLVDEPAEFPGILVGNEHRHRGRVWPRGDTGATRESTMHPFQRRLTAVLPSKPFRLRSAAQQRMPGICLYEIIIG